MKFRDISTFVCLDDKHKVKIGEPGYPVAAAERGRQVVVSKTDTYAVGDHDFTRFSIFPSVVLELKFQLRLKALGILGKFLWV